MESNSNLDSNSALTLTQTPACVLTLTCILTQTYACGEYENINIKPKGKQNLKVRQFHIKLKHQFQTNLKHKILHYTTTSGQERKYQDCRRKAYQRRPNIFVNTSKIVIDKTISKIVILTLCEIKS